MSLSRHFLPPLSRSSPTVCCDFHHVGHDIHDNSMNTGNILQVHICSPESKTVQTATVCVNINLDHSSV